MNTLARPFGNLPTLNFSNVAGSPREYVIASVSRLRGGPSVSVHSMLEALRRRGITVDLVTTDDDGGSARLDVPLDRFVQVEGQNVRFFPRQTDKYAFSTPMLGWLRAHVHQYDIKVGPFQSLQGLVAVFDLGYCVASFFKQARRQALGDQIVFRDKHSQRS